MSRALADALSKLRDHAIKAPASLFPPAQRAALKSLARGTGFVSTRPQGRGMTYHIGNRAGLEAHLRTLRPASAVTLARDLPRRSANSATRRDSKAGSATHAFHYPLLKAVGNNVSWFRDDGRTLDLSAVTRAAGAATLATQEDEDWRSADPLWLAENQAPCDDRRWLAPGTQASLVYYAVQIPAWLLARSAYHPRAPELILFPDCD